MTDLLELLAAKQHVLAQLQQVERQLDRFRGEDPHKRVWQTPGRRQECADRLVDCEALLVQIMAQEKQSEQELIRHIAALPLQPFQFGPYEGKPFSSHGDPSLMLIKPSARKAQFNMT